MKNESNLTQEEKKKFAQEYLYSTLHRLNFDIPVLARFFTHVYDAHQEQRGLLKSIEGGTSYASPKRNLKTVGEWGDYYIVETKELERSMHEEMSAMMRLSLQTSTQLLEMLLGRVKWHKELKKFTDLRGLFSPSVVRLKKYHDDRVTLRLTTIQVLLCGRQMEKNHVADFRRFTVPYWRKALETLRVQLHLSGKHTYNHEVQQVDSFLKILETSK